MIGSICHFLWYIEDDTWYSTVYNMIREKHTSYFHVSKITLPNDIIWLLSINII